MNATVSHKILVADDEPYMLRLMKYHLEKAGYILRCARNGLEAVELAIREEPRLVILDIMMPEMDGLAALKELKHLEITRDIPVIILTSSALQTAREQSTSSGAALFLTKPFSPTRLIQEIRQLLAAVPAPAHSPAPS